MRVDRGDIEGIVILRISGEIDFKDTDTLLSDLRSLSESGHNQVLINLSNCTGMVSSAIGVLVGWRCECSLAGGDFWVLSPSQEVRDIFDMVGVTEQLVRSEANELEAVRALGGEHAS